MRAKVASRAKGHVFEERFLNLSGLQLAIAYRQAIKEEQAEWNSKKETILALHKNWADRFENLFKTLFIFTNPNMYGAYEQMKDLDVMREEISAEEFPDLWDEILESIPNEVIVEEENQDPLSGIPSLDPELEEIITGFVPYKNRQEGGD